MKKQTIKCVTVSMVAVGVVFLMAGLSFAAEKFAYVELRKMFDEYERTKDADAEITALANTKQQERDELVEEIRRMKDEMVVLADKGDEKRLKQEEIDVKIKELQQFDEMTRNQLREIRDQNVKDIFDDLNGAIQKYGEKRGFDFVFSDRALAYKNEKLDITAPILKELNKDYK